MSGVPTLKDYQMVTDVQSLNGLMQKAKQDQAAALRPVAEQFEALFLNEILKESRKVKIDDGWLDGQQSDFYKQWYDQQLSQSLSSKGSLGLADMIVKQLSPSLPQQHHPLQMKADVGVPKEVAGQRVETKMPNTSDQLVWRSLLKH